METEKLEPVETRDQRCIGGGGGMNNLIFYSCPVCNSKSYKILYPNTLSSKPIECGYKFNKDTMKTYRIVECKSCGHAYANPRHKAICDEYVSVIDEVYLSQHNQRVATYREILPKIFNIRPGRNLLDIGCSTGDFLIEARNYYQPEGLELSKWAVDIARKRKLRVYGCLLKEMPAQKYDVITLWGVIEHLEYPVKEIKQIKRLLNKDGIVCLWTGDRSSITAKILGRKWWYIQGQHIQFFSSNSLDYLFEQHGFNKVYASTYPYMISFKSLDNSLKRYNLLHAILSPVLSLLKQLDFHFKLTIPGEMFVIYQLRSR